MKRYLAVDIGASGGRHIVGWTEDGAIRTREVYRFPNGIPDQMPFPELYRRTGIQLQPFNTVYQLCADSLAGRLEGRVNIALDYFDASINRVSAWVTGYRNLQKALLFALLQPNDSLKALQDSGDFTALMVAQEELKTLPFGEVWDEYCRRCGRPLDGEWLDGVRAYEKDVLEARA